MEKFLNKRIHISTCLGGYNGGAAGYKGVLTSYDDEFVCLDNSVYIVRKFIMSIIIK